MKAVSHQAQEFGIHFGYLGFWLGEANQFCHKTTKNETSTNNNTYL